MRTYEPFTMPVVAFKNFKDITLDGIDEFLADELRDSKKEKLPVEETRPYTELKDHIAGTTNFLEIMDLLIEANFSDHKSMFRDLVDAIEG